MTKYVYGRATRDVNIRETPNISGKFIRPLKANSLFTGELVSSNGGSDTREWIKLEKVNDLPATGYVASYSYVDFDIVRVDSDDGNQYLAPSGEIEFAKEIGFYNTRGDLAVYELKPVEYKT